MEGVRLNIRIVIMVLLVVSMVFLVGGRLYSMQIVNGAEMQEKAEKSITRVYSIPAYRGQILDRYGRQLVMNRLSHDVTLDYLRLKNMSDPGTVLLSLIEAVEAAGYTVNDTLPISMSLLDYLEEPTKAQKDNLERYMKEKGYAEDSSAYELVELLRIEFHVSDKYSEPEIRKICGIMYELELRNLFTNIPSYVFASDIPIELVSYIKEQDFPAVNVIDVPVRFYNTDFAAHIIGTVGSITARDMDAYLEAGYAMNDIVGRDGAEKAFEKYLHGTPGVRTEQQNSAGKVQNVIYTKDPTPGQNVYLTIDIRLQERVERILAEGIAALQLGEELKGKEAEAGSIVVTDVNTGEILAMASYPTFSLKNYQQDLAQLLEDPMKPLYNRSILGTYSPGSTFKMVTATAALESGIISPSTRIVDKGVYTYYKDYQPKCHVYPSNHGSVNIVEAIKVSCNYFFYETGRLTGIQEIGKWAAYYGLGQPTGIEIEGENLGYVAGTETSAKFGAIWYPGNVLSAAIGQSDNLFTPLQIASYIATIANGGTRYAAHLLHETKRYDFTQTFSSSAKEVLASPTMKESTLNAIQKGMYAVANEPLGSARTAFAGFPVKVAAKTGSVQVGTKPSNAVFVAYAPFDKPEIAITVVIEKGGAGSRLATISRDVLGAYFDIKNDMNSIQKENVLQK